MTPKTRRDVDREQKIGEIVDLAASKLASGGYPALSLIGISRELGIAQNSVYWYFPSKDHLFVAVGRRLMERTALRKPRRFKDLVAQVNWFVTGLDDFYPMVVAIHERASVSAVVAEFGDELEAMFRAMLREALRPYVRTRRLEIAVESFIATVHGLLLRRVARREREAVVRFVIEEMTGMTDAPAVQH